MIPSDLLPERIPGYNHGDHHENEKQIQSRSVDRIRKNALHALQKYRSVENQEYVVEPHEREPAESLSPVTPEQYEPVDPVYYQHLPALSEQAPAVIENHEKELEQTEAVKPADNYPKSSIEHERQVLKSKRPSLKQRHPLLKHFPKLFSYLDQDDVLDRDPDESEVAKHQPGKVSALSMMPKPASEQTLIPSEQGVRAPVLADLPPVILPIPPTKVLPTTGGEVEYLVDGVAGHHYTPQLSTRRPLLVPSLRLGLRLAMPLRRGKLPTSLLNTIPEPDYKSFNPLPRKLGSKVADRFYSSNIVQDMGLVYPPKTLLVVKFPSGADLCLGNPLSVLDSFNKPTLSWQPVRASVTNHRSLGPAYLAQAYQPLYTVIMVDPDLPLMDGQYVQWLQVNVPSPDHKGTTVVNYINPLPILPAFGTIASPNHRYVFLVYAQTGTLDAAKVKEYVSKRSTSFKMRDFVKMFALETQPVAGNFFYGRLYVKTKIIC